MQDIIDLYRANGIVVRKCIALSTLLCANVQVAITHNDQHAGQAGNFSPDKGGLGAVDVYW